MGRISKALSDIDRDHRRWAATERRLLPTDRDRLRQIARNAKLDRLLREQGALLRQIETRKAELAGQVAGHLSAESERQELARLERLHEALDRNIQRHLAGPPPWEGVWDELRSQIKTELGIVGHQLLLILGIAVANIVFFGLLILVFPYIWDWFWSFP